MNDRLYRVIATVGHAPRDGWSSSEQVPTFYVDASTGLAAIELAKRVLTTADGVSIAVCRESDDSDYQTYTRYPS